MTTSEILTLVRLKLLEAGSEIVEDATLLIYMNLVYQDIIKRSFSTNSIVSETVTFIAGEADLPPNFGTLYADAMDAHGNVFSEVSIADFARNRGNRGITVMGGKLKVSPSSTPSLLVTYYPSQQPLSLVSNPAIDPYLHEPIVYGTTARAFEDLQDHELALFYENKYEKMLTEKLAHLSSYEENAQYGGTMFNGIRVLPNNGYASGDPNHW